MCHCRSILVALYIYLHAHIVVAAGMTLEEAIDAHVQGRQLAHQASATITASNRHVLEGVVVRPKQTLWTLHWAQALDMERVRYDLPRPDKPDSYDWFLTPAEVRLLRNWPDESPPVLTPSNQHAVRASIWPNDSLKPAFDATTMLLRTLTGHPDNQRWGLEDLARHALSSQLLSEDATSLELAFELPPAPESNGNFQYTITLDKSANFSISKVVGRTVDTMLFTRGKEIGPGDFIIEWEVTKFADLGDGIYFPSHVSQVSYGNVDRCGRVESEYEITDLAVNEDVDPALFDFSFPENVRVVYGPVTSPYLQKVVLWGPDDKPARTIPGMGALFDRSPPNDDEAPTDRDSTPAVRTSADKNTEVTRPVTNGLTAYPFQLDVADVPVNGGPAGVVNLFASDVESELADYDLSIDGDSELEVRVVQDFDIMTAPGPNSIDEDPDRRFIHVGQLQVVLKGPCDYGRWYRSLVKLAAKSENVADDILIPIHVRTEPKLPRLVPDQLYVQAGARGRRTILVPGTDGESRISARSERADLRIEPNTTFLSTPDGDTRRLRSLVLNLDGGLEVGSHEVTVEVGDTRLLLELHVLEQPESSTQADGQ